ncbi:hypothetical protein JCM19037_1626 [Geomicrobium sp. JCM 19037]|nr:hypothetical protein JCM19037_1626 [Geomicrobium sp. JCM 19037]
MNRIDKFNDKLRRFTEKVEAFNRFIFPFVLGMVVGMIVTVYTTAQAIMNM